MPHYVYGSVITQGTLTFRRANPTWVWTSPKHRVWKPNCYTLTLEKLMEIRKNEPWFCDHVFYTRALGVVQI